MKSEGLGSAGFFGQPQIPSGDREGAVVAEGDQHGIGIDVQALFTKAMQWCEIVESRFGNAAFGKYAEAAVERRFHHALLFEDIGKGPVAQHFGEAVAFANGVGEEGAHVGAVGYLGLIAVIGIVFGPDEWNVRIGGSRDLLVHLFNRAADHFVARDIFVSAEDVFGLVISVDVRGDKIHRDIFFFAVGEETVGPGGLRGGRPTDTQTGADLLDGAGGVVVQIVIGGFLGLAGPEIDIGLVPDFEIPVSYFVFAVAID